MSFPNQSEKNKNLEYHKNYGTAILKSSINDSWALKYRVMQECYKFFNSGSSRELTSFLQKASDGSELPALWLSISSLKSKIEALVGEMEERGNEVRVRALSKDATARKLETKETLRVDRRIQQAAQFAQQTTGLQLQDPNKIPQSDTELDEFIDLKYKDKAELVIKRGLNALNKRNNWDGKRVAWFRDVWISNTVAARNEIVRGVPTTKHIDPLCFLFDENATDDELSDSTFFGEVYYMGEGEATERFNLTNTELEQAREGYNNFLNPGSTVLPMDGNFFDAVPRESVSWFKTIDGAPRIMVAKLCWSDTKERKYKSEVKEKYGTEHLQELKEEDLKKKGKYNIVTDKMNVWRQITLIGGVITREWGLCPNQPLELNNLQETKPPYVAWIPNYLLGQKTSKTEQVVGLELLRDMAMYNLQLAMNRAGGKGFIYDLALKPENMTFEQVLGYLKTSGITPVNSKEYQMVAGGMNVLREVDLSMSESIGRYIEIMGFIDLQTNSILGTSPERQGTVTAASQAVGVTQMALAQSSMVTAPYFRGFERFCSRVQTHQAQLLRMAAADRELFSSLIGDAGVDFLKENIDIELEEVGVVVESLPTLVRDRSSLENLVMVSVQSQQMSPTDAAQILLEPDLTEAVRKLQRKEYLRKMIEQQNAQATEKRQAELDQRLAQMDAEKQQRTNQTALDLQDKKDAASTQRTMIQSKTRLNEKKIDLLGHR